MSDARASCRRQHLDRDWKSLTILVFCGGFERRVAAGGSIIGRRLAVIVAKGAGEGIGAL
jgi:hypothetical protein